MDAVSLAKLQAEGSFGELLRTISDVNQELAYAVVKLKEGEYLHSNGSILGIVQHLACCKLMYASAAFRDGEVRWRDCAARLDQIASDWTASVEYLKESHAYWMAVLREVSSDDLDRPGLTNWGEQWPRWRIIYCVIEHDAYHAGQIEVLKSQLAPSSAPPDAREADDIRQHCADSPFW